MQVPLRDLLPGFLLFLCSVLVLLGIFYPMVGLDLLGLLSVV